MIKLALPTSATILCMLALRPLASAIGLVDRPGGRKMHIGEIPLIGGLAIALGLSISTLLGAYSSPDLPYFLASILILVATGAIDDRFDLTPAVRLCAQGVAILLMIYGAGVVVTDLGHVFAGGEAALGMLGVPFTMLIVLTAVNAFNMFDGSDGVAGSQALIGLAFLGTAAFVAGAVDLLPLIIALAGCVFGFLCFNWPSKRRQRMRAFMGDAGSTTLGFALAWFSISLSQRELPAISPVVALWFFALPVYDLFSSMIRRVVAGRSPLSPDAEHLHHVLRRSGLSSRQVAQLILAVSGGLAACGLAAHFNGVSDALLFAGWLALGAAYHIVFGSGLVVRRRRVPRPIAENAIELPELWSQRIESNGRLARTHGHAVEAATLELDRDRKAA